MLQDTRERSVRSWQDERNMQRVYAAAQAYDQLKRPKMALELYKKPINSSGYENLTTTQNKRAKEKVRFYS